MRQNVEIKLSFLIVLFLAVVYIGYAAVTKPDGGHPFGHLLGILGTIFMIMAETLYSIRKRMGLIRYGQVRHWLSFHIFTGIVGPALVLLHTGFEFRGLAGFTSLLTLLVVLSGFLGRYIYTAVPRTLAGVEVDRRQLEEELRVERSSLVQWSRQQSEPLQQFVAQELQRLSASQESGFASVLTRLWTERRENWQLRRALGQFSSLERQKLREIERLIRQYRRLSRQIRSLQAVRRLMGFWHMAHVPIGLTLFSAMIFHVIATIYFGALFQ